MAIDYNEDPLHLQFPAENSSSPSSYESSTTSMTLSTPTEKMELVVSEYGEDGVFHCYMCGLSRTDADPNYMNFNYVCVVIILPIIVIFGVIGNAMSALVFSRRGRSSRSSTSTYLTALAFSDIMVVLTSIFMFSFENLRHNSDVIRTIFLSCVTYVYPLALYSHTCSVYMTVSAGVDCFLATWFKKYKRQLCNEQRAKTVIFVVLVFSLAYNFTHFFEVTVRTCFDDDKNTTRTDVCMTDLRQNERYNTIYYMYMYTIVMAIGPLLLLSILNILIIAKVSKDKRRADLAARVVKSGIANVIVSHAGKVGEYCAIPPPIKPTAGAQEGPIVLILVVVIFIACNTLGLILNFLEMLLPNIGSVVVYLVDISNLLVVVNSSINFVIYYFFSNKFRVTLKNIKIACIECLKHPCAVRQKKSLLKHDSLAPTYSGVSLPSNGSTVISNCENGSIIRKSESAKMLPNNITAVKKGHSVVLQRAPVCKISGRKKKEFFSELSSKANNNNCSIVAILALGRIYDEEPL